MSYQVFARKYRPRTFADVLGQDHVVRTLRNAIDQDRLAHAYLFVGPRGTGKTSTARIFAKALNCPDGPKLDFDPDDPTCIEIAEGRSLDVLEIDGASNNGVEQVRELRETVNYAPASSRFKIYYIDEVHMLSTAAFNALLKTLEEPPAHVKFIFATTEPQKILPTIISRCQRFDLRPIPTEIIASHLLEIGKKEGISLADDAAWAIAKAADGGMRDAQSMFDQLVAFCGETITEQQVLDIFGFTSRETVAAIVGYLFEKDTAKALSTIKTQSEAGKDLSQLLDESINCLRNLLVAKVDPNTTSEGFPAALWDQLSAHAAKTPADKILSLIDTFAQADNSMKHASNKQLHFELAVIKAIQTMSEVRLSDVISTLARADVPDHPVVPAVESSGSIPAPAVISPPPVEAPAAKTDVAEHTPEPEPEVETPPPVAPAPEPIAEASPEPEIPAPEPEPAPTPIEPVPAALAPEPQAAEPAVAEPALTADEAADEGIGLSATLSQQPDADELIPSLDPPKPKPPERAPDAFARLDDLLEAAPIRPDSPIPTAATPAPKPKPVAKSEPAPEKDKEKKTDPAEEFYNDPLIQTALTEFEGTLKKV